MKPGDLVRPREGDHIIAEWKGVVLGRDEDYGTLPEVWVVAWSHKGGITKTREWQDDLILICEGGKQ